MSKITSKYDELLKSKKKIVVEINFIVHISMIIRENFLLDKNYLFESCFNNAYVYVTNSLLSFVCVKNNLIMLLNISRYVKLSNLTKFEKQNCFQVNSNDHVWVVKKKIKINTLNNEYQRKLINKINVYNKFEKIINFQKLIDEFFIFWKNIDKIVNLSQTKWMTIFLNNDWNFINAFKITQKIYSFDERNRLIINQKFDKLHRKNKIK